MKALRYNSAENTGIDGRLSAVTQEQLIKEINALYAKKKDGTATAEELKKLVRLRQEYLKGFRAMLDQTLENTVIQYPDGSRERLSDRKKKK